jgi:hypothetical protein
VAEPLVAGEHERPSDTQEMETVLHEVHFGGAAEEYS